MALLSLLFLKPFIALSNNPSALTILPTSLVKSGYTMVVRGLAHCLLYSPEGMCIPLWKCSHLLGLRGSEGTRRYSLIRVFGAGDFETSFIDDSYMLHIIPWENLPLLQTGLRVTCDKYLLQCKERLQSSRLRNGRILPWN